MTTHECGCAFFGPGPHPVDARHRNARGCEHAETGLLVSEADLAAALRGAAFVKFNHLDPGTVAGILFAALGAAQEKGETGS